MASGADQLSQSDRPPVEVIIDDCPNSGVFNMAMDSALLRLAADRETSVVRIYEWSEPTITLGYFQAAAPEMQTPFPELPAVRRLSGGGAILHHHEMTYSLVLPASHPARQDPSEVYEVVHRAIVALLQELGVECKLRAEFDARNYGAAADPDVGMPEPFLCFLRKNPNDIVHETGNKIVGSAQRRIKGITLQHGSVVLKASFLAPVVLGIVDFASDFNITAFRKELPSVIAAAIGGSMHFRSFSPEELSLAADIAKGKTEAEALKL